jgi:hypothetical protein
MCMTVLALDAARPATSVKRDASKRQLCQCIRRVVPQQVPIVPLDHLQARARELRDGEGVQLVQRDQIGDGAVPECVGGGCRWLYRLVLNVRVTWSEYRDKREPKLFEPYLVYRLFSGESGNRESREYFMQAIENLVGHLFRASGAITKEVEGVQQLLDRAEEPDVLETLSNPQGLAGAAPQSFAPGELTRAAHPDQDGS